MSSQYGREGEGAAPAPGARGAGLSAGRCRQDLVVMNPSTLAVRYAWRAAAAEPGAATLTEGRAPEVAVSAADFEATLTHSDTLLVDEVRSVLLDSMRTPAPPAPAPLSPSAAAPEPRRRQAGLSLKVDVGSLTVALPGGGAGGALAARLRAQRFALGVEWDAAGGCAVEGTLGAVDVADLFANEDIGRHPSLFSTDSADVDSLVAFRARYPPPRGARAPRGAGLVGSPGSPGEDDGGEELSEIKVFVNRPRITVLFSWIADLRTYLASFGSAGHAPARSPRASANRVWGETALDAAAAPASDPPPRRTRVAIELQHPVVVVPRSSVSAEAFVADLVPACPALLTASAWRPRGP